MADQPKFKAKIIVAGDPTIDWYFYDKEPAQHGENWRLVPSAGALCLPGGAWLLTEVLRAALSATDIATDIIATPLPEVANRDITQLGTIPPNAIIHSNAELSVEEWQGPKKDKPKRNRWYVSQERGFIGPDAPDLTTIRPLERADHGDIIVLGDLGNGFRTASASWPLDVQRMDARTISDSVVVHKIRQPLDRMEENELWKSLKPWRDDYRHVVVLQAEDLRRVDGVQISRGLSWEQTALDCTYELQTSKALAELATCPHIVVTFGWDGAIYLRHGETNRDDLQASLLFDPQCREGSFAANYKGRMYGTNACVVAMLVASLVKEQAQSRVLKERHFVPLAIEKSLGAGLQRARYWIDRGIEAHRDDAKRPVRYPIAAVLASPHDDEKEKKEWLKVQPFVWSNVPLSAKPEDRDAVSNWRILDQESYPSQSPIAKDHVRTGNAVGLRRVPAGVFADLCTFDRKEIESYAAIRKLIEEFVDPRRKVDRPLSLAVFGPPGAGKTFGVKNVIASVGGGAAELIEFNVSQFGAERDLVLAFHRVRDAVLKGKTPCAFFDEFDCPGLDRQELGWLRLFLAPMQDGKFRDGEEMHPLGKCILIFAGGTCDDYPGFERKTRLAAKTLKGPDFVSRLRGYINVMGPNQQSDEDTAFQIRRANMLRANFKLKAPSLFGSDGELRIDSGVLHALLEVKKYKHGTRSMEAVLDMSAKGARFELSSLPPREQLSAHVDADHFLDLAKTGGPNPDVDSLSKQKEGIGLILRTMKEIIEKKDPKDGYKYQYQVRAIPWRPGEPANWGGLGRRPTTPLIPDEDLLKIATAWRDRKPLVKPETPVPFQSLPRAEQRQLLHEVMQIPRVLADAGFEILRVDDEPDWHDKRLLDKLALKFHEGYRNLMKRLAKNPLGNQGSTNPSDDEFKKLPIDKQESNRDAARTVPRKLRLAGYKLVPLTTETKFELSEENPKDAPLIEELAQIEHARWNWQSILQGYVFKPGIKDLVRRTNPNLVLWVDVPEEYRGYDRDSALLIPKLLEEAELGVQKVEP